MQSLKSFRTTATFLAIWLSAASALGARLSSVERVSVVSENPLRIQIQTSRPAAPQVQMVSNPERLVIDIPNSAPGEHLHALNVGRGDVSRVRVSCYSTSPPVTRVVVDLNSPEWYRVEPNASGLVVSLGASETTASSQPAIGWLSSKNATVHTSPAVLARTSPAVLKNASAPHLVSASANGTTVQFSNGQLTIHAHNATLSEVLFQVQKITGAEIAIPAGTEQDRVAADFGPGTASEVLGQLLNGTGLNFVVVGSASDPNQLRSVILSRTTGGADPPSAFVSTIPPASAPVIEPDNPEMNAPPPANDPPPDHAPN